MKAFLDRAADGLVGVAMGLAIAFLAAIDLGDTILEASSRLLRRIEGR